MSDVYERIEQTDTDKVSLYLFSVSIDGTRYGGHIPAKSIQDAQKIADKFNGTVDGVLVEQMNDSLCAVCAGNIVKDLTNPEPFRPQSEIDFNEDSPVLE